MFAGAEEGIKQGSLILELEKLSSEGQTILTRLDPYGECQPKILNPKLLYGILKDRSALNSWRYTDPHCTFEKLPSFSITVKAGKRKLPASSITMGTVVIHRYFNRKSHPICSFIRIQ
jgi:hypothetical protein